jgi:hypothetical protein
MTTSATPWQPQVCIYVYMVYMQYNYVYYCMCILNPPSLYEQHLLNPPSLYIKPYPYTHTHTGDVNGDGFADLLVGAYGASPKDRDGAGI